MVSDEDFKAIIEPAMSVKSIKYLPETFVLCFSKRMVDNMVNHYQLQKIGELASANGAIPLYAYEKNNRRIGLAMARVGASACVVELEELYAMGVEQVVMLGSAGVLSKEIRSNEIIIPVEAISDEGTSKHYQTTDHIISMREDVIAVLEQVFQYHQIPYQKGITWTTDAPYRETKGKLMEKLRQGCICVEMECSACLAVSAFRKKRFLQFLYAADHVDCSSWNPRELLDGGRIDERMKLLYLAMEVALTIA